MNAHIPIYSKVRCGWFIIGLFPKDVIWLEIDKLKKLQNFIRI